MQSATLKHASAQHVQSPAWSMQAPHLKLVIVPQVLMAQNSYALQSDRWVKLGSQHKLTLHKGESLHDNTERLNIQASITQLYWPTIEVQRDTLRGLRSCLLHRVRNLQTLLLHILLSLSSLWHSGLMKEDWYPEISGLRHVMLVAAIKSGLLTWLPGWKPSKSCFGECSYVCKRKVTKGDVERSRAGTKSFTLVTSVTLSKQSSQQTEDSTLAYW